MHEWAHIATLVPAVASTQVLSVLSAKMHAGQHDRSANTQCNMQRLVAKIDTEILLQYNTAVMLTRRPLQLYTARL